MAGERQPKQRTPVPTTSPLFHKFCSAKTMLAGRPGAAWLAPSQLPGVTARTALCVFFVEDDDWSWCFAPEQSRRLTCCSFFRGRGRVQFGGTHRTLS